MIAETITFTLVIRPTYADAATVRQEVMESLEWLTLDQNAAIMIHQPNGTGEWPDDPLTENPYPLGTPIAEAWDTRNGPGRTISKGDTNGDR